MSHLQCMLPEPLFNEDDSSQLLGGAPVDCENLLLLPNGLEICSEPPSSEAPDFAKPASEALKALVERKIARKWEGDGWCLVTITRVNEDARRTIGGVKVNFFIRYNGEDEELAHVLTLAEYQTTEDAAYESWMLLEKVQPQPDEGE